MCASAQLSTAALVGTGDLESVRRVGRWLHCRRAEPKAVLWHAIDSMLVGSNQFDLDERRLRDDDHCCPP